MTDWKIVDEHGDEVISAESIAAHANMMRTSPRLVAQREARVMNDSPDPDVFAVRA